MSTLIKGATISLKGFFTTQIHLQGQSLAEIEHRLGFHSGRLSKGAWFLSAMHLPNPNDFEFAGYSQVASHHTAEQYGALNAPVGIHQQEAYDRQKRSVIAGWRLYGVNSLVKVLPAIQHNGAMRDDDQYPPGSGIPQWKLNQPITFKVEGFVGNYPDGRFIPEQGFKEIKYR